MSATMKRGTMPEAERLARKERRILKRVAAYKALMEERDRLSRRDHLIELLDDRVRELEEFSPDGAMPAVPITPAAGNATHLRWVKAREDLYRIGVELEAMGPREEVTS